MKKIVVLLILICASLGWGQQANLNLDRTLYGYDIPGLTARSLGMGGAGLANGSAFLAATHNPALLINSRSGFSINGGIRLYNLEEDRSFPYYDNFGGFVDYGSYYYQNNWYNQMYGQVVWAGPKEWMNLHLGTGYIPFKSFDYDYFEEVRSSGFGDALLAYNIIKSSGNLFAIPLDIAVEPLKDLSLGLGLNFLSGDDIYQERIVPKTLALDTLNRSLDLNSSLDGMPIIVQPGLSYHVDQRLTIGASYRLPYTLKTKISILQDTLRSSSTREVKYPARFGTGIDYRFQNILTARLMLDYYYDFWSKLTDTRNIGRRFEDTYRINVGVEQTFFNNVDFRVGFAYQTLKETKSLTRFSVTAGLGFNFSNVEINLAAGFSNSNHNQKDLYNNALYGEATRTDLDRVSWSETFGRIDFSYTFK